MGLVVCHAVTLSACVCVCGRVCTAECVHAGDAPGRLERHLGRGFPQHPGVHRREGHHASGQPEAERVGVGQGAAECADPSSRHGRHPALEDVLPRRRLHAVIAPRAFLS